MNRRANANRLQLALLSFFMLLSGTIPYLLFRQDVIFLNPTKKYLSCTFAFKHSWLSDFVIYNYPDGAWLLSLLLMQRYIGTMKVFEFCAIIMALMSECGQYFKWIPGTFDLMDIFIYIIIFILYKLWIIKLKSS